MERLEKQGKQLEKEIQQLKVRGAQAQAESLKALEIGPYEMVVERIDVPDHAALRGLADKLRARPASEIFLMNPRGLCVTASGDSAQKTVSAVQLWDAVKEVGGGAGGGRSEMTQGKVDDPAKFPEIREKLKKLLGQAKKS